LSTVSEQLVRDTQDALSSFGIFSVVGHKITAVNNLPYPVWMISLYGQEARLFHERIGFRITRKQVIRRPRYLNVHTCGYPDHMAGYLRKLKRSLEAKTRPSAWRSLKIAAVPLASGQVAHSISTTCAGNSFFRY